MKFFLDSANLNEITILASKGLIRGITTNPTLIASLASSRTMREVLIDLRAHFDGVMNAEVIATEYHSMREQAEKIHSWDASFVIKLPGTPDGLQLARELSAQGIQTNITLITTVSQAIMAAEAGAMYVSPFVGRLIEAGRDGVEFIRNVRSAFDKGGYNTSILAASIRTSDMMDQVASAGADIVTAPYTVYESIFSDKVLTEGLARFESAAKQFNFE